uniref:Uncharacterized protein n=1 Tax=viral metagenome TaxID=1070528 RepID=A0A6M3LH02_9ZZZZ
MPNFDRTGPRGQGPMTGRGLGYRDNGGKMELEGQEQSREEKTRVLLDQIMQTQDINEAHSLCQQAIALVSPEVPQEGQEAGQSLKDRLMAKAKESSGQEELD